MGANLFEGHGHDFGAVVDSEDDICDTGGGETLDLVVDHRPIGEFNERLGHRERLVEAVVSGIGVGIDRIEDVFG